jgi:hypothetical protein
MDIKVAATATTLVATAKEEKATNGKCLKNGPQGREIWNPGKFKFVNKDQRPML